MSAHRANAHQSLPTGAVTFLFTDIEGSTRRWEQSAEAMREAVQAHDRIVRAAIEARGGYVFKTIGDAFCAAFQEPGSAVAAALDAQRMLADADFSQVGGLGVRMAINTGRADERDGDYFGPSVNRVARLLSVTHGGQVLALDATARLLNGMLPGEAAFVAIGTHRLKDLDEPQPVHQLVADGLRRDFPALRSVKLLSNNLPAQGSSFVGRDDDVGAVQAGALQHRLTTVLGSGGIGKTRLALRVAELLLHEWPDGVWFVALAPLADGPAVPRAVASAMDATLAGGGDGSEALVDLVGRKRLLLVLDNCEHLLEPVAALMALLLRRCPNVSVLATSRQPLGVSGEVIHRLTPLAVPAAGALNAEAALSYDAVALFASRAAASDTRFILSDEVAPSVASVCRRLDGIPLAIELAAARIRLFGAQGLLERLDDRFRLLTSGARDADERQRTLQATIDWSYDLLSERERSLFRRTGVFADTFSTKDVAVVAGEGRLDDDDTFEALCSLEDKSLIIADADSEAIRFRLLESVRAYALARMDECGERARIAQRHLEYFRVLAERAESEFMQRGSDSEYTLTLAAAVEDIRGALAWSLSGGDIASGAALVTALGRPWARLGLTTEGIARVEAFIAAVPSSESRLLARLWTELAWLAGDALHSARAYEAGTEAVRWARESGDAATQAWALAYFALVAARLQHFDEGKEALSEARSLAGPDASPGQRLTELEVRATVALLSNDLESAATAYDEQLTLLRAIDDRYGISNAMSSLAETEHARGNTRRAMDLMRTILEPGAVQPGVEQHAGHLANFAGYLLASGEIAEAKRVAREAVAVLSDREPASPWVTIALEHYALGLAVDGAVERAARLEGYCDAAFASIGFAREATERITHRHLMEILRGGLETSALAALLSAGAQLRPHEAIEETV